MPTAARARPVARPGRWLYLELSSGVHLPVTHCQCDFITAQAAKCGAEKNLKCRRFKLTHWPPSRVFNLTVKLARITRIPAARAGDAHTCVGAIPRATASARTQSRTPPQRASTRTRALATASATAGARPDGGRQGRRAAHGAVHGRPCCLARAGCEAARRPANVCAAET